MDVRGFEYIDMIRRCFFFIFVEYLFLVIMIIIKEYQGENN